MGNSDFSLAAFGSRERYIAGELLLAWANEAWASSANYLKSGATLEFNPNTGDVYLVDKEYNVVTLNDEGKLENLLSCRDCDLKGLRSEVNLNKDGLCSHCAERVSWGHDQSLEWALV